MLFYIRDTYIFGELSWELFPSHVQCMEKMVCCLILDDEVIDFSTFCDFYDLLGILRMRYDDSISPLAIDIMEANISEKWGMWYKIRKSPIDRRVFESFYQRRWLRHELVHRDNLFIEHWWWI
jgi:hypothetical protein